jgi:mono/diheme cytochrome c family protein
MFSLRHLGIAAAFGLVAGGAAQAQEIYAGHYPQQTGEEIYQGICQGCHMPNAKGAVGAGAYPALAQNEHLQAAIYPATVIIGGRKAMPSFGDSFSDQQIANVVNYVRTHFGNDYKDPITPAEVAALRPAKK